MIVMPIVGLLMKKGVQPRYIVFLGIIFQSTALHMMSQFNLEADFFSCAIPRIVQAFGLGMFFVPLATASYANIPQNKMGYATGLFNLLRNLSGSFGIAFSTTVLTQRAQFHQNMLVENITPFDREFQELVYWLKAHMPLAQTPVLGDKGVLAFVYREVLRQANMLAFNDTFFLLSILVLLVLPLPFFMKGYKTAGGGIGH
jgi:DHA2 family multidrug resistance protein